MQEAYRPWHIKYYSRWGTPPSGYLTPPGQVQWGEYPRWGTPYWGTPCPGPMGGTSGGVPPIGVPPQLDLAGVPSLPGLGRGTPC